MNNTSSTSFSQPPLIWSSKIEADLDIIRLISTHLSDHHLLQHINYRKVLHFFRIPVIFLSAFNSFLAIGMQPYMNQTTISTTNTILSLVCSIVLSIELYLNIQKNMENDFLSYKLYYKLSLDIKRMISIERDKRYIDGVAFHTDIYEQFIKIQQQSNILEHYNSDALSRPISIIHPNLTNTPTSSESTMTFYDRISYIYSPKLYKLNKQSEKTLDECELILRRNYSQTLCDIENKPNNLIRNKPMPPLSSLSSPYNEISNVNSNPTTSDNKDNDVLLWNNNQQLITEIKDNKSNKNNKSAKDNLNNNIDNGNENGNKNKKKDDNNNNNKDIDDKLNYCDIRSDINSA